ncbi:riboflavin synthase [Bacillus infantis]|jgi:riboflavin synthase|uniref:riboflavin synthase n=1 Tax=Bacillus infantis TaxID=324767 RepID=UPI002155EC44|nr:riboflavin synthase [Bacillus infantis]MCR6611576.1 riboflavin synthase [Bacillus infantis]
MFTGLIEEVGRVEQIVHQGKTLKLSISASLILEDVGIGDSIAVNGVCLTVTDFTAEKFSADVMPETYHSTSLAELKRNSPVNLERAMKAGGRFGGHLVSGHIDARGSILRKRHEENAIYYEIEVPEEWSHLAVGKGSIAIDGVSLTIFETGASSLTVSLIPHTAGHTILGGKKAGETVNLEFDMLGKYIYSFMNKAASKPEKKTVSEALLRENGFL